MAWKRVYDKGMRFLPVWLLVSVLTIPKTLHPVLPEDSENTARTKERAAMVREQIARRGIQDSRVLEAFESVRRHLFVPGNYRSLAYQDHPLPIGYGQTISQPYIVALMTALLNPSKDEKILEIGTGSGYQAAILGELAGEVYTIEIVPQLADQAKETLEALDYKNVEVRAGDGFAGWPSKAPFDGILLTAAPREVPDTLFDQLKTGGRLIAPVGDHQQELKIFTKTRSGLQEKKVLAVRFVPMTGLAEGDLGDFLEERQWLGPVKVLAHAKLYMAVAPERGQVIAFGGIAENNWLALDNELPSEKSPAGQAERVLLQTGAGVSEAFIDATGRAWKVIQSEPDWMALESPLMDPSGLRLTREIILHKGLMKATHRWRIEATVGTGETFRVVHAHSFFEPDYLVLDSASGKVESVEPDNLSPAISRKGSWLALVKGKRACLISLWDNPDPED